MDMKKSIILLSLALVIGVGPTIDTTHAQGCFALEMQLNVAVANRNDFQAQLVLAEEAIAEFIYDREQYQLYYPDLPFPRGLTDDILQSIIDYRDHTLQELDYWGAEIERILDELLSCDSPPQM